MHAGDVDDYIHEAVEKTVRGLDAATTKLFVEEGKTLHNNIFSLMRTRDPLEKLEEAREVYVKNKAPHTMAKFGVAFDVAAAGLRTQLHNLKTDDEGSMADALDGAGVVTRRDYSLLLSLHPSNTTPAWLAAALTQRCLRIFKRSTFGTK